MSEIKNEIESTGIYNNKIVKIFENQRITLNRDIIFLKEDILKDFKRIETNLNTKYEKLNANVVNKLYKFESIIEAMKTRIDDLSSLISTDKNIQQKVLQLTEFKRKITDKVMNQEIALKVNSAELKESINKYDRILTDSVIYPGIIGNNGQFRDFHEMIDFILLGINQFNTFKEKNAVDFKDYAIKIENLYKSLKAQTDSIVSSCNTYCTKQIGSFDTKIGKMINSQELTIIDMKKESNEMNKNVEEKMKELSDFIRIMNKTKNEIYKKFEEQINSLNEYKSEINKAFDIYQNDFEKINKRLKIINNRIKQDKKRNKEISFQFKESNSTNNQNSGINLKKTQFGKSIVKKYIKGEISYNEMENSQTQKKNMTKIQGKNSEKRMTLGPDNLGKVLEYEILNKNADLININTEKSLNKKSQKMEEVLTDSSFDKSEEDYKYKNIKDSRNIHPNKNFLKVPSLLNDEEYKSSEIFSTKQKAYKLLMFQNQKGNSSNKNNKRYIDFRENKTNFFENDKINEDKNSRFTKLKSIGDNINIINHNNKNRNKRKNNKNGDFYEKINNMNNNTRYNYYSIFGDYKDLKIKNTRNKLNVIEVNFDQKNKEIKDKDKEDLQDLIKKIKDNRHLSSERKNFKRKSKIIKLSKSDIVNNPELLYKNKMIKDQVNKYKSYDHINNNYTTKNSVGKGRLHSSKYN